MTQEEFYKTYGSFCDKIIKMMSKETTKERMHILWQWTKINHINLKEMQWLAHRIVNDDFDEFKEFA